MYRGSQNLPNFGPSSGESAVGRALDTYVGTIFKPLVLLRPAWTVRVIAEEQLRAVANGALGVLDHPIGLLARIFDDSIGGFM